MKVLIFSRYTRLGASSRLRLYQYLPFFEERGIVCEINALMNDRYLNDLYTRKKVNKRNVVGGYLSRFKKLVLFRKYDALIIEKEIFPFLPAFAEWGLRMLNVPYIVDYDDAVFHNYDLHPSLLVRTLLRNKIKGVMRNASVVVCGNAYLAAYANAAGAKNIIIIPTVIDTDRYGSEIRLPSSEIKIGWIGSPSTLKYLGMLKPVMEELGTDYRIKLCIMGGKSGIGIGGLEEVVEWSEDREAAYIASFDIGIMPLFDSPWEQGKCGYKLIQYMGSNLPVAGSPIGVNKEIIQEGVNGFKPKRLEDWKHALEQLITDANLRHSMGAAGRKMAEERYSIQKERHTWINLLMSIKRR